ncbi:MAG: DUF4062 domain-containing protein [Rhodanobacteraceae bacterium]|nr:DUF4062 domain-containing protein [Rhodanobacteraceae bacterium]
MAYTATVIPVMIASPGDVFEERKIVRAAIHDWNDVNAATSKVMLAPVGWDTHASPELGSRPQELINSRLLKNCDLLIGVFWTRLGTPSGEADSGTVEEIEKHVAAGKPAMIYFSSRPVAPESIDQDQYAKLTEFRERCKPLGLIESFENTEQFRSKVSKQLQVSLNQNQYLQSILARTQSQPDVMLLSPEPVSMSLSEEAIILLKQAGTHDDGVILKLATLGGRLLQVGGKTFGGGKGRESAKWENALQELLDAELVVARGYKDQVFELTHAGWAALDSL